MAEVVNGRQVMAKDFFSYNAVFPLLTQNTSQTQTINIQADSDFAWLKACYFADNNVNAGQTQTTRFIPNCTVLIVDTGSGRQLMDKATPLYSMFGCAENPFILTQPKIFSARAAITITVSNVEPAAQTYNLRLALIGTKIFYTGNM